MCPALGVPFFLGDEKADDYEKISFADRGRSPSIDRIQPHLGYVEGNVAWISFKANQIKSEANSDEIELVAKWLDNVEKE